jgi:UDP-N-acetylglucosamine 2-epimerase
MTFLIIYLFPLPSCSRCLSDDKYSGHTKTDEQGFDVRVTLHRDKFLIIKPIRCTNFSNLFLNETLHVSDSSSVHYQEFFTVHTAMVYVIQVC